MIFTFYSYKGGVGRSMALANIGEWFYQQGARVLMIDWDLEAPGLESFFYQSEDELNSIRTQKGLIDLLLEYRKQYALAARTGESQDDKAIFDLAIAKLKRFEEWLWAIHGGAAGDGGRQKGLWLLTAGSRHGRFAEYAEAVHDFNWAEFYSDYQGENFFQWLRKEASPEFEGHQLIRTGFADVVLLDSRTGITEMGGVCTQELADVVVAVSAPNLQNLAGIETMARSFRRPEILQARNGKPEVIIVPSRLDASEIDSRNRFEKRLRAVESEFIPSILVSLKRSFWDLKIPYVPRFAYEEALTIEDPTGKARYIEAGEMAAAYRQLAANMAMLTPTTHPLRQYTLQDTTTLFEKKRVYLTWAGAAGTALANSLRLKIETGAPDIDLWLQQRDSAVPVSETQTTETIVASSSLLLALTPESLESDWIRGDWRQARQSATCVFAVYSGTTKPTIPVWLRKAQIFEVNKDWTRLLQTLRSRCGALRAPFMAPDLPATHVSQKESLKLLRGYILASGGEPQPVRCVLHGIGGSGKSILAAAFCHEQAVIDAFDDGILWVTLRQKPDVRECLTQIYVALTGERPSFTSEQQASFELGAKMSGLNCLVVLDDVWDPQDLQWFYQAAKNSTFIATTRNAAIASDSFAVHLGEMSVDEAANLLNQGINLADTAPLLEVADRLARLPLALYLARGILLERIKQGETPERACQYLQQTLNRAGFQNFGEVGKSLERSLTLLSIPERQRFYLLAGFPERASIPVMSAAKLWRVEEIEAETQIQQFARLSLLEFNPSYKTFLLHPMLRSYIETIAPAAQISQRVTEAIVAGHEAVTLISIEAYRDLYRLTIQSDKATRSAQFSVNDRLLTQLSRRLLVADTLPAQAEAGRALSHLLLPKGSDEAISYDLPIVVRAQGAATLIPWEMLIPPNRKLPLGLDPGLTRAFPTLLSSSERRQDLARPRLSALVIAPDYGHERNWNSNLRAQEEAEQIVALLERSEWEVEVNVLVGKEATTTAIINTIAAPHYDLVHFAGSHFASASDPAASGWVFEDVVLGVRELFQLFGQPPAFIFSNSYDPDEARSSGGSFDLAAALAQALASVEVANFVLPSPAIFSPAVASRFAVSLYRELLAGNPMHSAMGRARESIRQEPDGLSMWGAYQHYGNPFFRLRANEMPA